MFFFFFFFFFFWGGGGLGGVFFLVFFSSGGHFVHPSRTILAIFVAGHSRNIHVKLFQNPLTRLRGDVS